MSKEVVKIELENWDYTCADGCCYDYGTTLKVNGIESDNHNAGDDVETALKFTLNQLGYEVEITQKYEE